MTTNRQLRLWSCIACLALAAARPLPAATGATGHWEGTLTVAGHEAAIVVDLDRGKKDAFVGEIDVPEQAVRNLALEEISVEGKTVSFRMSNVPGDPIFKGTIAEDGKSISGALTQSGQTFPFKLERKGKATLGAAPEDGVKLVEKGIPGQGAEGEWHGLLDAGPAKLRLIVYIARAGDGSFKGTMDSIDQEAKAILLDSISFDAGTLKFGVSSVKGSYAGSMSTDGSKVTGSWTQGESSLPLELLRAGK